MNNRELSIQITLGGFSFQVASLEPHCFGEVIARGSVSGYDLDANLSHEQYARCFCEWSVPGVLIIPRELFDKNLAQEYLVAGGLIESVRSTSHTAMSARGKIYAAVWAVDAALARCVDERFLAKVHSHPLLDLIENSVADRECIKVVIDSSFVAHIGVWDHTGLVVAESVQLSSNEDLLYYVRQFSAADPFMVYRLQLMGQVSPSLELLFRGYYMSTDVVRSI